MNITRVGGWGKGAIVSAKYKVSELKLGKESNNVVVQDVLIDIPTNNKEVGLADTSFKFLVEVLEESLSWISIAIVIMQVLALLGIYA